jgi:DNA modification methylase
MTEAIQTFLTGDALDLHMIEDKTVDLVVTSPPYFALRAYKDAGEILDVVGNEATPEEYLKTLDRWMQEMKRVLKPSGSVFVVLGDKYAGGGGQWEKDERPDPHRRRAVTGKVPTYGKTWGVAAKSLIGLPWRFAINQIDAGWILRQEVVWYKPNGLPESVKDRCRRSHETIFHFTKEPRYYSAIDRIRDPYSDSTKKSYEKGEGASRIGKTLDNHPSHVNRRIQDPMDEEYSGNPLGKLPDSVWTISTSGLRIPPEIIEQYQTDKHFAAFPPEIPLKVIQGWSPEGICVECKQGRVPVTQSQRLFDGQPFQGGRIWYGDGDDEKREAANKGKAANWRFQTHRKMVGESCACDQPIAPTTPGVILDPFGGSGTTALVSKILGRSAISVDISAGYTRLSIWRVHASDHADKLMSKWAKKGLL